MAQPHSYLVKAVIDQHIDICFVCASIYALCWVKPIFLDILKGKQYPCMFLGCLGHERLPLPAVTCNCLLDCRAPCLIFEMMAYVCLLSPTESA